MTQAFKFVNQANAAENPGKPRTLAPVRAIGDSRGRDKSRMIDAAHRREWFGGALDHRNRVEFSFDPRRTIRGVTALQFRNSAAPWEIPILPEHVRERLRLIFFDGRAEPLMTLGPPVGGAKLNSLSLHYVWEGIYFDNAGARIDPRDVLRLLDDSAWLRIDLVHERHRSLMLDFDHECCMAVTDYGLTGCGHGADRAFRNLLERCTDEASRLPKEVMLLHGKTFDDLAKARAPWRKIKSMSNAVDITEKALRAMGE